MQGLNILARRCLPLERLDQAVAFREELIGQKVRLRFKYPERGLRLTQVASILFIGGTAEALASIASSDSPPAAVTAPFASLPLDLGADVDPVDVTRTP